ncbi:MAG TPA: DUF2127 domain-containing protein [Candidatus Angelobacter sp.]|jgi:hypothetical protein
MGRPTGVTVIAVLYFIGAAFCLLGGLLFIAGGGFLATIINQQGQAGSSGMAGIMAGLGAAMGIMFLVFGVIDALVGWGLLKLKNWARIVAIVFAAIGACFQLLGVLGSFSHFNLGNLIINLAFLALYAWMISYLIKAPVKAAFQGVQARAATA